MPRELVDWPARLETERPLLERLLSEAPSARVLDLGCGSGRHARLLAELGAEVVAIDGSETALEEADAEGAPEGVQFLLNDLGAVERSVRGHFGLALCLGNTLAHLLSPESVSRMLAGLRRRLLPGGICVLHGLNYDRIFAGAETLPIRILPADEGELLIVDRLAPREDGIVLQTTTVLRSTPAREPIVEVAEVRRQQLRGWRLAELEAMLGVARLPPRRTLGDMSGAAFDVSASAELVIVAG